MFERLTRMFGTDDTEQGAAGTDDDHPSVTADAEPDADDAAGMEWQSGDLPVDEASGTAVSDGGSDDEVLDGPTTEELDVRLDDLEEELESTGASVRAVQSSQEEMADAVAEVNDTVRRLVGVYDRLAAEQNPFLDGPEETTDGASVVGDAASADGTGLADDLEPHDGTDTDADDADDEGDDAEEGETDHERPAGVDEATALTNGEASVGDDGVVSFADLHEDGGAAVRNGVSAGERDGRPRSGPGETAEGPGAGGASGPVDGPLLESLPDGYASEVVVMEWLSTLLAETGAAGALRAVEHYEDAGWISSAVTRRLVDVLAAPELEDRDGRARPREPTDADHVTSYGYVRALARLAED